MKEVRVAKGLGPSSQGRWRGVIKGSRGNHSWPVWRPIKLVVELASLA